MMIIICLLVLLTAAIGIVFSELLPVVTLAAGQVGGKEFVTRNNKTYYGFRGIPYAKSPIGDLRFEPPEDPLPWIGILDATEDAMSCISILHPLYLDTESEDCLYVNVYTPSLQTMPWQKLPVMFWIYGGDFIEGESTKTQYGPDFFMEENVILVTFNYRLGAFGFLSTGDGVISGNMGLKDQNKALKWTYDNIANFGGDPEKITIFGQSAGGVSVATHLLSEKSKGLFRAAIIESASTLVPWAFDLDPKTYALIMATLAGYIGDDSQDLKNFLKNKTALELYKATDYIKLDWPVLEVPSDHAFITESSYELFERGDFNRVPTIIGMCSEESLSFLINPAVAELQASVFDINPEIIIPTDLNPNSTDKETIIKKIRDLYIPENETLVSNLAGYAKYVTDNFFSRGIIKHAELQSVYSPVYLYQFSYYGRRNSSAPAFIAGAERVGHSSELAFLFEIGSDDDTNPKDLLTQRRLVRLWANFAKYTKPTPVRTPLLQFIDWPTVSPGNMQYLNINETLSVKPNFREDVYRAWVDIFETYGKKPFVMY